MEKQVVEQNQLKEVKCSEDQEVLSQEDTILDIEKGSAIDDQVNNSNNNQEPQQHQQNQKQHQESQIVERIISPSSSPSAQDITSQSKNFNKQFYIPFLSNQAAKKYQSFFEEQQQNPETYKAFIKKYFKAKSSNPERDITKISKKNLEVICLLPIDHKDYQEALFFGSLIGKYSLERFIQMLNTNMDTPEKQVYFIKWYKSELKEQLINFGKMKQK